MGFYFNSYRQKEGDKAYNEKNFELALLHYSEALKTLNLHAASNKTLFNDFYDALVYVLSEVITTKLMIISREIPNLNFDVVKSHWQEIPSLMQEMEMIYAEHLSTSTNLICNKENITAKANSLVATVCEEFSDEIVDQLDEDNQAHHFTLSDAIEWMNRAINFQVKTRNSPKLSSSLGYLNLLERQYKETEDYTYIKMMNDFIDKYKLMEMSIESPLKKLELLSYAIRVAFLMLQDVSQLTQNCIQLYAMLPPEDRENPILEDLQNLIRLETEAPQDEEEESDEESMNQYDETATLVSMESDETLKSTLGEDDNDFNPVVALMSLQTLEPIQMDLSPSFGVNTSTSGPIAVDINISQSSPAPKSSTQTGLPGFFSSSQNSLLESEIPHSRALQLGLEKITSNVKNPKFLANLLSLVADFFTKYQAYGIQKQNAIVLGYDLYRQVLKIDPQHQRANVKLKELGTQHGSLIGSYKFFSSQPQSLISTSSVQMVQAKYYFNEALEELTVQLESLLMNKPSNLRMTIDRLICYIGEQLSKGSISNPSPEMENMLTQAFEEELKHSSQTKVGQGMF